MLTKMFTKRVLALQSFSSFLRLSTHLLCEFQDVKILQQLDLAADDYRWFSR